MPLRQFRMASLGAQAIIWTAIVSVLGVGAPAYRRIDVSPLSFARFTVVTVQ